MKGFKFLLQAAEAGDRSSMIIVARAYDTGDNLSADRSVNSSHKVGVMLPPGGIYIPYTIYCVMVCLIVSFILNKPGSRTGRKQSTGMRVL